MALFSFTELRDKVLLWVHGRRLGIAGDGQASTTNLLVLDGVAIGSTRTGPSTLTGIASGSNGAGPITVAGTKVGDNVVIVINLTTPADATSSFEAIVSVAGQVQQTSASNLSGNVYEFQVAPAS